MKQAIVKNPVKYLLIDENFKKIKESENEDILQREANIRNKKAGKEKYFVMGKSWGNVENPRLLFHKVSSDELAFLRDIRKQLQSGESITKAEREKTHRLIYKAKIQAREDLNLSPQQEKQTLNELTELEMLLDRKTYNPKFIRSGDRFLSEDKQVVIDDKINKRLIVPSNKSMLDYVRANITTGQIVEAEWKGKTYIWTLDAKGALTKLIKKENGAAENPHSYEVEFIHKPTKRIIDYDSFYETNEQKALQYAKELYKTEYLKRYPLIKISDVLFTIRSIDGKYKKPNFTNADFNAFKKERLNDLTQMFQGEIKGTRKRLLQSDYAPKDASLLGQLVLMKIKRNGKTIDINFDGESFLTMDIRKNFWVKGKDARIKNGLSSIGVKKPRKNELKILGDLIQSDYITAKTHIENGELTHFYHYLGEVDKEYPKLAIDYDGFPIILGGGYDIWDVGIVN